MCSCGNQVMVVPMDHPNSIIGVCDTCYEEIKEHNPWVIAEAIKQIREEELRGD